MWRHVRCSFFIVVVGLLFVVEGKVKSYSPPPPAAVLAEAVLSSDVAASDALASEDNSTVITYRDLQGTTIDASDNISNTTVCQLGCKLTEGCNGWKFCPGPMKCTGEAVPGGGNVLYSPGTCLLLSFMGIASYAPDVPDKPGNGWVSSIHEDAAAAPGGEPVMDGAMLGAADAPVEAAGPAGAIAAGGAGPAAGPEGVLDLAGPLAADALGAGPAAGPMGLLDRAGLLAAGALGAGPAAGPTADVLPMQELVPGEALGAGPAAGPIGEFMPVSGPSMALGAQSAASVEADLAPEGAMGASEVGLGAAAGPGAAEGPGATDVLGAAAGPGIAAAPGLEAAAGPGAAGPLAGALAAGLAPAVAAGPALPPGAIQTPPGALRQNVAGTPILPDLFNTEICATACNAMAACDAWKYCVEGSCPLPNGESAVPGACQLLSVAVVGTVKPIPDTTAVPGDGWMSGISAVPPAPAPVMSLGDAEAPGPAGALSSPCANAPLGDSPFATAVEAATADDCVNLCVTSGRCTGYNFFCGPACIASGSPGVCNILLPPLSVEAAAPGESIIGDMPGAPLEAASPAAPI
eukprot:jgi/Botrbrau1/13364/Bobra.0158s0017.1